LKEERGMSELEGHTGTMAKIGANLLIEMLKGHGNSMSCSDVMTDLDCSPTELRNLVDECRVGGVDVFIQDNRIVYSSEALGSGEMIESPLSDSKEIVFGVTSDLHFGSKACQITGLNQFCKQAKQEGVKHILVPGDVFAGIKVYQGQEHDIYASSAEEQERSLLRNLPTGFDWYMLAGNHDYDFVKRAGHNPVLAISKRREDIHYLGGDVANIPLIDKVEAQLWHPSGGIPYAYSYRLQKGVEQLAFQELYKAVDEYASKQSKIRFFLAGHLHIQMQALFGPIFACQSGGFEGRTNYLKRKGYFPVVGGYIIKATLKKGNILRFEAPFIIFPDIEDDYKNYDHAYKEEEDIQEPLFSGSL